MSNKMNFNSGGGSGKTKVITQKIDLTPVNKRIDEIDEKQNKAIETLDHQNSERYKEISKLYKDFEEFRNIINNRLEILESRYNTIADRNKSLKQANDRMEKEIKALESRLNNYNAEMYKLKGKIAGTTDLDEDTKKMIDNF